jgi:hypothetical protein
MRRLASILAVLAAAPAAAAQQQDNRDDEIVVTADRPRGSIPGDTPPETTFSAADVRSYGASSIFQILMAIAPHTGSASIRGGGGLPIVLVNGRRITGFQEIRDLPPDVISRVEVFDEQVALQYGFSPNQRVVNLVLEREFNAETAEIGGGAADGDARASTRFETSHTNINEGNRLALGLSYDDASAVTELERDIAPPFSGPDARNLRTLAPALENWRVNATLGRALNERVTANASLRLETSEQISWLGLDAASVLRLRNSETELARATAGLDGAIAGWQWTATATGDLTSQDSRTTDSTTPARTSSDQSLFDITANANGALFGLPAGSARLSARAGVETRRIESLSVDAIGEHRADLDRSTPSARMTFLAPITSRRREFGEALGDISLNVTSSWADPSDFAALTGLGYGASWSPAQPLRFSVQIETSETAPTLQQLGDPLLTTPGIPFFDAATGQDVVISRTTGGNNTLLAEERDDVVFNANWSPPQVEGFTLSFSWARNDSANVASALPTALAETEAAFPARFTRDLGGTLIAVDARPINIPRRDIESIRWGVSFSAPIGAQRARTARAESEAQTPHGPQSANTATDSSAEQTPHAPAAAPPPHAGPASPAMQRIGLGNGARAGAGRWNISVFHRVRLLDEVILAPGAPVIDLLDRGGLDGGGEPASSIEFEGGVFYRGIGLRLNGGWSDSYTIPVASGGALDFSDRWTLNGRLFINFNQRERIIEAAPFLRDARLALGIDNVTDSVVEVRDSFGQTPVAYQEGYLSPLGRVVQLSFRKQW